MHDRLRSTTLQEVRLFLEDQATAPPAWSSPSDAIDALYVLLRTRRTDPGFWDRLGALLARLEDARVHPDLIRGAEALDGATIHALLADLRAALPTSSDGPRHARGWVQDLGTVHALVAFLLLGVATGCPTTTGAECDDASARGYEDDEAAVYCELADLVDAAGLESYAESDVLNCLPTLSTARRQALLDAFRDLSGDELVDALNDLAASTECNPDINDDDDDDDH